MNIFTGSFHPHLEDAFVSEVLRFKASDPFRPLLILVPSELLRRRLKILLTLEQGLNLIHCSILTFHQLAIKLCEAHMPSADLSTENDLFFEEVLRHQLQQSTQKHPVLTGLEETEGGSAALWQCLRDLRDGLVDAEVVLSAVNEGHFEASATRKLSALFQLYRNMQQYCNENALLGFGDLAILATRCVPTSSFLKGFSGIFYYGFYDLTQVQMDFFHAVGKHYDTSLFFPLVKNNAGWDFSRRFYERHIEGLVSDASQICDLSLTQDPALNLFDKVLPASKAEKQRKASATTIINCYDIQDEVRVAAKEIVRLVSEEGLQFHEIGVIARDPAPYLPHILQLFQNHAIPVTTNCQEPLLQYPYAMYVLLLMRLRLKGYMRAQCVDLLSSPCFESAAFCENAILADKALWDRLTRQAGVDAGHASWQRLSNKEGLHSASAEQAALLLKIFNALHDALNALPPKAAYSDYVSHFQGILKTYLGFAPPEAPGPEQQQTDRVKKKLWDLLEALTALDCLHKTISLQAFVATFERCLNRATIPVEQRNVSGVSVFGAMSARGLPFRFIFLLGLNEGTFPRSIREDPFLSDPHRRVLETVLGYKVGEKLAAYDEERLILTLVAEAARERLFVLYHRVGGESDTAGPSWYLKHLSGEALEHAPVVNEALIPRSLLKQQNHPPFHRFDLLLPSEAAKLYVLSRWPLEPVLKTLPFLSSLYQEACTALRQIESRRELTPFDGLCGPLSAITKSIKKNGMTPTGLEQYARCPFQFFAAKILKLRPLESPEDQADLPMTDAGELCHDILKNFYTHLHQHGFFEDAQTESPAQILNEVINTCFQSFEKGHKMRYPLVWEETKQQMTALLRQVVRLDIASLLESGYRPVAFEVPCRGTIEAEWPEMQGRIDRIDFNQEEGLVRVVDYKYTLRKQAKAREKNLGLSAIRGERLQAPIYQKLAEVYGDERTEQGSGVRSAFYFLAPNWPDGPLVVREFPEAGWEGEAGILLRETMSMLLAGINTGRFFMMPGEACTYCEFATACRKNHLPSRRRVEQNPHWEAHKLLKKKKLPKR